MYYISRLVSFVDLLTRQSRKYRREKKETPHHHQWRMNEHFASFHGLTSFAAALESPSPRSPNPNKNWE